MPPPEADGSLDFRRILLAKWVLSFETVFVLFLFAGVYKAGVERLPFVKIDITVFFAALTCMLGAFIIVRRGIVLPRAGATLVGLYLVFAALYVFTATFSPGRDYALVKAGAILTFNTCAIAGTALIIGVSRARFLRFCIALITLASVGAVAVLLTYLRSGGSGTVAVFGSEYLGISRLLSLGSAVLLASVLFLARNLPVRAASAALLLLLVTAMFLTGGRGPVIATAFAALLALFARGPGGRKSGRYRVLLLFLLLGTVLWLFYFLSHEPSATVRRFGGLIGGDLGASGQTRVLYYGEALHIWADRLIWGHGIGSWPLLIGIGDQRAYPHNIILEIGVEGGLIAFLAFVAMFARALSYARSRLKQGSDPFTITALMMIACTFVNAFVSGDLADNRVFFAALGAVAVARLVPRPRSGTRVPTDRPVTRLSGRVGSLAQTRSASPGTVGVERTRPGLTRTDGG